MKTILSILIIVTLSVLLSTPCLTQSFTQEQKIRFLQGDDCLKNEVNYQNLLTIAYADNRAMIDSLDKYKADLKGVNLKLKSEEEKNNWLIKIGIFFLICAALGIYFSVKFYKKSLK